MIEFMKRLALQAGEMCLEASTDFDNIEVSFKSAKDLVTETDQKVEAFLKGEILKAYPEHTVIGEESGESRGIAKGKWLLDPIDGTVSFVHGLPIYTVSLAYLEDGLARAGVVYAPVLNQMFAAERGNGTELNDSRIRVSQRDKLIEAVLATGFACVRAGVNPNNLPHFNKILLHIRDIRRMGSAALDLAYVAAGKIDGFWEMCLNDYDVAAGILLVQEAGGQIVDFNGSTAFPQNGILATNGLLTDQILELLQEPA